MSKKSSKKVIPKMVLTKKEAVVPKKKTGMETYSFWVSELKKVNAESPEKLQLSFQKRREIVSELYPNIKGKTDTASKEKLRAKFKAIVKKLPKELIACNPNTIDKKYLNEIEFYSLDSYIKSLPDCLNVKVSASIYGTTKIFNTRSYNYIRSGTQQIVEEIRSSISSYDEVYFQAIATLKDNKKADLTKANNYFLDLVLIDNGNLKAPSGKNQKDIKPKGTKVPTLKAVPKKQEKKKAVKKKPLYKKNEGFKIENKAKKEQIILDYNKAIARYEKLFKMGILPKELYLSEKKEITKEKNDAINNLPKLKK
jgi:hypothetical protein